MQGNDNSEYDRNDRDFNLPGKQISEYDNNDRDASLKLIHWFEIDLIRKAKILVVGAGAIGNEILKNLALLGVGNIFIFDRDTIEKSNLSRSILYRASDAGQLKAEVAARSIKDINPTITPRWLNGDIRFDLGLGFINRMDVVIAGFDNLEARRIVNGKCWIAKRPWIEAGISIFDGQVAVYYPEKGACYECNENSNKAVAKVSAATPEAIREEIDRRNSCRAIADRDEEEGKVPTTPTIASIVAGVQVQEALKLLAYKNWESRNLINKKFKFEGTEMKTMIYDLTEYEHCEVHQNIIDSKKVKKVTKVSVKTTVRDFVRIIKDKFGEDSNISLNFDLVVEMKCVECQKMRPILQPLGKQFKQDLVCDCGWVPDFWDLRVFKTTDKLTNFENFQYREKFLNSTLGQISIPPLEWLQIYSSNLDDNLVIEISGDEKADYGFNLIQ